MKEAKNKKPNYQVNELIVIWVLISIMILRFAEQYRKRVIKICEIKLKRKKYVY